MLGEGDAVVVGVDLLGGRFVGIYFFIPVSRFLPKKYSHLNGMLSLIK